MAVVMITLNEAHNIRAALENISGWAREVFIVDSYSQDNTVDIALEFGATIVQRKFRGFGDQWNFALKVLPISAEWTMKLDPDERLSDQLKDSLAKELGRTPSGALEVHRRLWLMGRPLPVRQWLVRLWRTGSCRFSDVSVNEHPIVDGAIGRVKGELDHYDSPDLEHWIEKQNRYSTLEARMALEGAALSEVPRLFGTSLQRRMWLKKNFRHIPLRYFALFVYHLIVVGAWRAGWVGFAWSRLRSDVMRMIDYKYREMKLTGRLPMQRHIGPGRPDPRVAQYE